MNASDTDTDTDMTSPARCGTSATPVQYWLVLMGGLLALWSLFGLFVLLCLHKTGGHFIYTTDDSYISMTVARNLVQNGTWGIQPGEFASLVSNPAWVLLMAAVFRVAGPAEWVPLAMNGFFATLLFVLVWAVFRDFHVRPLVVLLGLFLVLFLTPLVPVAFTGLEHMLQSCIDLAYVFVAGLVLGDDAPQPRKRKAFAAMMLLSPLLTLVRYEGMFLLAAAGCVFLARKQIKAALLTGVLGLLPVVVSGLIFMSKGWFFLPSTIIQKGNVPNPANSLLSVAMAKWLGMGLLNLHRGGTHLGVLMGLILLACLFLGRRMLSSRLGVMVFLFLATALLHLQLARLGWFFRYEAYLVCLGLVILVLLAVQLPWQSFLLPRSWPAWARAATLAVALALVMQPLLDRAVTAHYWTPNASRHQYEQQYQMARFVRTYYEGDAVAMNDIGAISFFGGVRCCDLAGLANVTVARMIRAGRFNTASIRDFARQQSVKIAIVYDSWYDVYGGLPPNWVKTAEWTISENYYAGSVPTVSFYATDSAEVPALRRHLQDFNRQLPKSVVLRLCAAPNIL